MMKTKSNEINVNLSFNLNSSLSVGLLEKIVSELIDHLLQIRAQIPFTFDFFEKFLFQTKKSTESIKCYKKLKQIEKANITYGNICSIKQIIKTESHFTRKFMIIFGSTVQTAKESYLISFPETNYNVLPTYKKNEHESSILRTILLQIVSNEKLKHFDTLPITNTFVLFNKTCGNNNAELSEIRNFTLNKGCKQYFINLSFHDVPKFEIFQDESLRLVDDANDTVKQSDEKVNQCKLNENGLNDEIWYQSKVFVKGFQDILVNKKSIWN